MGGAWPRLDELELEPPRSCVFCGEFCSTINGMAGSPLFLRRPDEGMAVGSTGGRCHRRGIHGGVVCPVPDLAEAWPQPQEEGSTSTAPEAMTTTTTHLPLPDAVVMNASSPPPPAGVRPEHGCSSYRRFVG